MTRNSKGLLFVLLGAAAVGALAYVADNERRSRLLISLRGFAKDAAKFQQWFVDAMDDGAPIDVRPYQAIAASNPEAAVAAIIADVHREVAWVDDRVTSGRDDFWQSPRQTVSTLKGDCEDKSMLALDLFRQTGVPGFRLAVGMANGKGHAWLEHDSGYFADPTSGAVGRTRPAGYEPAAWFAVGSAPVVRAGLA